VRDWLFVDDHCAAIALVIERGTPGEIYNVGGGNELTNFELTEAILRELDRPRSLIRHVEDRPGHDRRYSVDSSKLRALGWQPSAPFETALRDTISWYRANERWWRPLKTGDYLRYYRRQYGARLSAGSVAD